LNDEKRNILKLWGKELRQMTNTGIRFCFLAYTAGCTDIPERRRKIENNEDGCLFQVGGNSYGRFVCFFYKKSAGEEGGKQETSKK